MKLHRGGLHVDALVSGGRDVKRVCALVTTAARKTVISPKLAVRVAETIGDPSTCTASPSIGGRRCGPTAKVDVVVKGCKAATVRAVVAPLPTGVRLAIGRDVIEKSVREIQFSPTRQARFVCRLGRRP